MHEHPNRVPTPTIQITTYRQSSPSPQRSTQGRESSPYRNNARGMSQHRSPPAAARHREQGPSPPKNRSALLSRYKNHPSVHTNKVRDNSTGAHHAVAIVEELTCDYDRNPTLLYELLESSVWDKVRGRCRSHPDEVKTFIIRYDKAGQKIRWKLLPLHAAIIFQAPTSIVQILLERYSQAASLTDDQGMLPLHLAFRHALHNGGGAGGGTASVNSDHEELLELLLVQYPKAVMIQDRRQRVPLEHGREGHFSAKLMKLYADATVAGARALSTPTSQHDQLHLLHQNQQPLDLVYNVKQECDHKITQLSHEHDKKLQAIKQQYEERLEMLREHHARNTRNAQHAHDEARQTLGDAHQQEVHDLRELHAAQRQDDQRLLRQLESEMAALHRSLRETQGHADETHRELDRRQRDYELLQVDLATLAKEHAVLHELAVQHQDELAAARSLRQQLMDRLLRQEDNASAELYKSSKLVDLAEKVGQRLQDAMDRPPQPPQQPPPPISPRRRELPRTPSPRRAVPPPPRSLSPIPRQSPPQNRQTTPTSRYTSPGRRQAPPPVFDDDDDTRVAAAADEDRRSRASRHPSPGQAVGGASRIERERRGMSSFDRSPAPLSYSHKSNSTSPAAATTPSPQLRLVAQVSTTPPHPHYREGTSETQNTYGEILVSPPHEEEEERSSGPHNTRAAGAHNDDDHDDRVLGDEISAITDHSRYH